MYQCINCSLLPNTITRVILTLLILARGITPRDEALLNSASSVAAREVEAVTILSDPVTHKKQSQRKEDDEESERRRRKIRRQRFA